MKFENLNMLVPRDLAENNVPMLIGEPGIGKSSWVEAFTASVLHTRCFCLACNQLADKADMTGCRLVEVGTKPNGEKDYAQVFYPHKVIRDAIKYAEAHPDETPVLFLDEINRSTPDVTSEALSIPTMRSIGDNRIPDNLKVIIAGNDKGNVCAMDKASVTRFVLYRIEPDAGTFLTVNKNLSPYVVNVLKKNPSYVFMDAVTVSASAGTDGKDDEDNDEDAFEVEFDESLDQMTTPRTITSVSRWLNGFAYDELMTMLNTQSGENSLLQECLIAHCGNTPFTMALLEEIINASPASSNSAGVVAITEPPKYRVIHQARTRDELQEQIDKLSDDEKSEMLVYAIYDQTDNAQLITMLAPSMTGGIKPRDMANLTQLSMNHGLDRANLDVLMNQNCQIVNLLKMINL